MTTGASNGNAAQEGGSLRGKILRLRDDGSPAPGNPFEGKTRYKAEIYSLGHRNSLGLAFNPVTGDLWKPKRPHGGDEINVIKPGGNYGWPKRNFGREYTGPKIPNFAEGMIGPIAFWAPSIAPSGMAFYTGDRFPGWRKTSCRSAAGRCCAGSWTPRADHLRSELGRDRPSVSTDRPQATYQRRSRGTRRPGICPDRRRQRSSDTPRTSAVTLLLLLALAASAQERDGGPQVAPGLPVPRTTGTPTSPASTTRPATAPATRQSRMAKPLPAT